MRHSQESLSLPITLEITVTYDPMRVREKEGGPFSTGSPRENREIDRTPGQRSRTTHHGYLYGTSVQDFVPIHISLKPRPETHHYRGHGPRVLGGDDTTTTIHSVITNTLSAPRALPSYLHTSMRPRPNVLPWNRRYRPLHY